jgi:predicted lipid-binding transport protein (Tim44 family)
MSGAARPAPKPRAPRASPPATRAAAPRTARAPAPDSPLAGWRRWLWVGVLVLAVLIGLPLAHALFGEVVALLGGMLLLGFLLGRWTAPRR